MQAYDYRANAKGRGQSIAIPKELMERAQAGHEALVELVAEGKDELMEEFFTEGTLSEEHLVTALHEAIREDRIFPVMYSSGLNNIGTDRLLDFFRVYAPAPIERTPVPATLLAAKSGKAGNGNGAELHRKKRIRKSSTTGRFLSSCSRPSPIHSQDRFPSSKYFPDAPTTTIRFSITSSRRRKSWPIFLSCRGKNLCR